MTEQVTKDQWLRISYSSSNTFNYCARKFEFGKIWGQTKTLYDNDSIPANVGSAFHAGYQHYIVHRDLDQAIFAMLQEYPWELAMFAARNPRTWDVVLNTFIAAIEKYDMAGYEIMTMTKPNGEVVPCVEVPFELRFKNTQMGDYEGIAFIGYIDLILQDLMTQLVASVDIKTHQRPLTTRAAEFTFNSQQLPYGLVVEHLLQKPVNEFEVIYLDCELSLEDPMIVEHKYVKDRAAIEEWIVNRTIQFRNIKQMIAMDHFTRRENGCVAYQYPCRFMDICQTRDKATLQAWFNDLDDSLREWEPWVVAEIDIGEGVI